MNSLTLAGLYRPRFRRVPDPPARQRLLALPPPVRHVPLQLHLLPALSLQHEGEHGHVRGGGEGTGLNRSMQMFSPNRIF